MGSKARFAKEIIPIILKDRKPNQWFADLFCGGCNLLDKVDGKRIGNDRNQYLIALWKGLQEDRELIMDIPKELFSKARDQFNGREDYGFDDFTIGWIGFMGGFNGRFYGGGYSGKHGTRDYVAEQIRNTLKQKDKLKDVRFFSKDYSEFDFKEPCIIYCDPPYFGTKEYDTKNKFDHVKFWDWCRETTKKGHQVFVSEYSAPDDFECVWQKDVKVSIRPTKTLNQTEKLFKYCPNKQ
jgi:DNA adenine methylase